MDPLGAVNALQAVDVTRSSKETEISKAITSGDKSKLLEIFEEVDALCDDSKSFRWASKSTQEKQDVHLREYRLWMSHYLIQKQQIDGVNEIEDDDTDENDDFLFRSDLTFMSDMLRK